MPSQTCLNLLHFDEEPQSLALFAEVGYNDAINSSISSKPDSPTAKSDSKSRVPPSNSLTALNDALDQLYDLVVECCKKLFESNVWQAQSVLLSYLDQIFLLKYRSTSAGGGGGGNQSGPTSHRRRSACYSLIMLPKAALKFLRTFSKSCGSKNGGDEGDSVIRASIARQLSFIFRSRCFDKDKDGFEQFAKSLMADIDPEVRRAVAESIGGIFTNRRVGDEAVPAFIEASLGDLLSDNEVDVISSASKNLRELIHDDNENDIDEETGMKVPHRISWRMRKNIAELIPKMASKVDEKQFEKLKLIETVKLLINDDADQVRRSMILALHPLASKYGEDWTNKVLVPIINDCFFKNKKDYNLRKTAVEASITLRLKDGCKELLKAAVSDPVPNVRLVLARELPRTSTHLLQKLMKDDDPDVAYFASLKNDE